MEHAALRPAEKLVGVVGAPALTVSPIKIAELRATRLRSEDSGFKLSTNASAQMDM